MYKHSLVQLSIERVMRALACLKWRRAHRRSPYNIGSDDKENERERYADRHTTPHYLVRGVSAIVTDSLNDNDSERLSSGIDSRSAQHAQVML